MMGKFPQQNRLYMLLLIFVLAMNVIILLPPEIKGKHAAPSSQSSKPADEASLKQEKIEKALSEDKHLALLVGLVTLLVLFVIFLGLVVDIILVSFKLKKGPLEFRTYDPGVVSWSIWDVAKVVVLFLFFGYMAIMVESVLAKIFPVLRNDNFRMMANTSVLDTLTIVFIFYFTIRQYGSKLASLGVSLENFSRNVFYGAAGYVATVPLLVVSLIVIAAIASLIKYSPPPQPVVEIFLKEKNTPFLIYASVFAALAGPIVEEIFFRGFMYNALKKSMGVLLAMCATAAIFAALHTNMVGFIPIMILGILLTYLYEKTGTLVASITVHVMHNFGMTILVFLIKRLGV